MDYQGNYFPEEHDERESKLYRIVKNIFDWTIYIISFAIYAIFFFMFVVNRDSVILESNYMNKTAQMQGVSSDDILLYNIYTQDYMNTDDEGYYTGSVQLYDSDYAKDLGLFEIGIKYNVKEITGGSKEDIITVKLFDSEGNECPIVNREFDTSPSGGRYSFLRICFSDVEIDFDSNDMLYDQKNLRTDNTYTLCIYTPNSDIPSETFTVYDNETLFEKTKFTVKHNTGLIIAYILSATAIVLIIYFKIKKQLNKAKKGKTEQI